MDNHGPTQRPVISDIPRFTLWELAAVFFKARFMLIAAGALGAMLGYALSTLHPPIYRASATISLAPSLSEGAVTLSDDLVDDWLSVNRSLLTQRETLEGALELLSDRPPGFASAQFSEALRIDETKQFWDLGVVCRSPDFCAGLMEAWLESSLERLRAKAHPPADTSLSLSDLQWLPGGTINVEVIALGRTTQILGGAGLALLLMAGFELIRHAVRQAAHGERAMSGRTLETHASQPQSLLAAINWTLWLCLLFVIPFSSSPLVTAVFGFSAVSPLALFPLIALVILYLLPHLWQRATLSGATWSLTLFVIAAGISMSAAGLLPIEPLKGFTAFERGARAFVTLGIGVSFYLVSSLMPQSDERTQKSLKVLYAGAVVAMMWGTIQAYFVLTDIPRIPFRFEQLHAMMVIRHPFEDRISGLAYEPSWFADQLIVLYLPLWIGSLANRHSVFISRKTWLSPELFLSLWGVALLALTFSRIGYLAFLSIIGMLVLAGTWRIADRIAGSVQQSREGLIRTCVMVFSVVLLILLALAVVWGLSLRDRRMTSIFEFPAYLRGFRPTAGGTSLYNLAGFFGLSERFVYWAAGLRTFLNYPLTGVGLGNSGLLFPEFVPPYGTGLAEIEQILDPAFPFLANPKNLWVRLLAETGVFGMLAFSLTLAVFTAQSLGLLRSNIPRRKTIGLAGLLGVTAICVEGLSLDTFALPQMWVILGLISAQFESGE